MEVKYLPVKDNRELRGAEELRELTKNYEKITIMATTQFSNHINKLIKKIGGINGGVILGCSKNFPASDCYIVITTGLFHAINVKIRTGKKVFIINPEGVMEVSDEDARKLILRREARKAKVLEARTIGVIESTKPGQKRNGLKIVKELRKKGYEAYLFVTNEVSANQLNDFPVDAWINTACPRITEDDFDKPMINWNEIKEDI